MKSDVTLRIGRNHWAFKPVRRPPVPAVQAVAWGRNPIDSFILAKLEANGLAPNSPASKAVLLRRVFLDLTGLPPRFDEVEAFQNDRSDDAFARVVDRLLNSPQYGEHWARYWLDVARYADTKGRPPASFDTRQPHAWTYRDWVINAFNHDLPYDKFILAQLAGDYLHADAEKQAQAQRPPAPESRATLAALGFLTLGDQFGGRRVDVIDDQINVTTTAFLGLTAACARCHDHKTDPIPTKDYYSLYGVFANSVQPELLPTLQSSVPASAEYADYLEKLAELEKRLAEYKVMHEQYLRFKAAKKEGKGEGSELSNEEIYKMYLKAYRHRLWANLDAADLEMLHPGTPPRANALVDVPEPTDYPVLLRGVPFKRGEKVPRRMLGILTSDPKNRGEWREGSGRRQLAEAIADAGNPLTARVFVNRVWQQFFGSGIVETPDDFGQTGALPTHPELLDWLAATFVEQNWSIKSLHRMIVLSSSYQQSSDLVSKNFEVDPGNKLRWRYPVRRLSFEMMHDSMLAATGQLDLTPGGKPVSVQSENFARRRAIYTLIDRTNFPELFAQYDLPSPDVATGRRSDTVGPQQALFLMNNPMVIEVARKFVKRPAFTRLESDRARLTHLYQAVLQRKPTEREIAIAIRFLAFELPPEDAIFTPAEPDPAPPGAPIPLIAQFPPVAREQMEAFLKSTRTYPRFEANFIVGGEYKNPAPLDSWTKFAHALLQINEAMFYH